MRTPADMPTMIPATTAADFMEERDTYTPDPWEVEKARLNALADQVVFVYQEMRDISAADAIVLTELVLNRFDDGVRP